MMSLPFFMEAFLLRDPADDRMVAAASQASVRRR
jgi:hypothetical protein